MRRQPQKLSQSSTGSNSQRITDFFARKTPSSSQSLSQPLLSSSPPPSAPKKAALADIQPLSRPARSIPAPKPLKRIKKENAPPPRDAEVISISSDSRSHISISSTSVISIHSSSPDTIPDILASTSTATLKGKNRARPIVYDLTAPANIRRRSPRLHTPVPDPALSPEPMPISIKRENMASPKKIKPPQPPMQYTSLPPKKRKRRAGIQSSDEEDAIDIDLLDRGVTIFSPNQQQVPAPVKPSNTRAAPRKAPTAPPKKKRSNVIVIDAEESAVVPSSQSEERELLPSVPFKPPSKDLKEVARTVEEWREQSSSQSHALIQPSSDDFAFMGDDEPVFADMDINMDMDYPLPSHTTPPFPTVVETSQGPLLTPLSTPPSTPRASPSRVLENEEGRPGPGTRVPSLQNSPSSSSRADSFDPVLRTPLTPPDKPWAAIDASPKASAAAAGVSRTIADIRARAKAKARATSPSPSRNGKQHSIGALSDSEDSDLEMPTGLFATRISPTAATRKSNRPHSKTGVDRDSAYLGDVDGESSTTSLRRSTRSSLRPALGVPMPLTATTTHAPTRKKAADPFKKMEREKEELAKLTAVSRRHLRGLPEESSSDEDDEDELTKTTKAIHGSVQNLARDQSDAIEGLLVGDVKGRSSEVSTVPFWDDLPEAQMECEHPLPSFPDEEDALMKQLAAQGTFRALLSLIRTKSNVSTPLFSWLFVVACGPYGDAADEAFAALQSICTSLPSKDVSPLPSSAVLAAIGRLHPSATVLAQINVQVPQTAVPNFTTVERDASVWNVVFLLETLGKARLLDSKDVPVYITLLVATGMDPSAEFELTLAVCSCISILIVTYMGTSHLGEDRSELERSTFLKLVALSRGFSAAQRASLLSFIDGDAFVARRLAQWIACAFLAEDVHFPGVLSSTARSVPLPWILAFVETSLSSAPSAQNCLSLDAVQDADDGIDFATYLHNLGALSRVLRNIPAFVREDDGVPGPGSGKGSRPREPILVKIRELLDQLGNRIGGARARNDTDKMQAKSCVHMLSMRIRHQRKEAMEAMTKGKDYGLDSYLNIR